MSVMMTRARRGATSGMVVAAMAGAVSCGYALTGRLDTLPPHIKIVAVTPCVNHTQYADIDARVTAALTEQWQSKPRYIVRSDAAGADAVLTCTIVRLEPNATEFKDAKATRYALTLVVSVEFRDKHDNDSVLFSDPNASARTDYPVAAGDAGDVAAFLRQNSSALDRLSREFARAVVTSILEKF